VVGSHSGGIRHHLNHVAHILHDGNHLEDFQVRSIKITKKPNVSVKASSLGPLTWLSLLGFAEAVALVVLSIHLDDGMSLLATCLLASLSTLIGIGAKWNLVLPKRKAKRVVPQGDVVVLYPHGAFLVVKCNEDIARELYWAPEKCEYMVNVQAYRFISLTGTLMLMGGVIALANASLNLQVAWAAAYMVLNAAYWIVAALPQRLHWDLAAFDCVTEAYEGGEMNDNFTQALWMAIAITGSTDWARIGDIAPTTRAWNEWLIKAAEIAGAPPVGPNAWTGAFVLPSWDCQRALDEFLNPDRAATNV
jgi:hypothetical protein